MLSRTLLASNLSKVSASALARAGTPTVTNALASISRGYHEVTGDIICPSMVMGIDHLRDPRLNKGLAFTLEERQVLGIHGLQPARFKTQEEQLELCKISINRYQEDLNKYLYLIDLQDRNEKLFFRLLSENVEQMMPIVYTPTVGLACQKFGLIYRRPRGLFITINDRGHVYEVLRNWPEPDVRAIVVTDGERILGLGDLGACGMGIPVGKLALYTALAGIQPHQCLPIQIDVGTNNQDLIEDPLYIGLRQKRIVGEEYDSFIDEFMQAVVKRYGQNTLIQFEDFGNHNAFRFLDKYRNHYCTFNDDIQGTAAVAVAGLYASRRITNKKFTDNTFLFAGAGEAAIGIADLCVKAMQAEGITQEEARSKIWMVDIDGLLTKNRPKGKLEGHKKFYAKDHEPMEKLEEIVNHLKPSVLIGASAASGLFTPKILTAMASFNERPIVFALSNPTSKAECTAEQAFHNTDGRVIFASGSPFGTVHYDGKTFSPGQGNNAYIFPGVALGVNATMTHHIPDDFFLIAARELSDSVSEADLEKGSLYPPLSCIREVSMRIAMGITKFAYDKGLASTYPEPTDKRKWLENQLFNFNYESSMPVTWPWPKPPMVKTRELVPTKLFRDPKLASNLSKVSASALARAGTPTVTNALASISRGYHEVTGDIICPSMVMGIDHLRDPRLNKGLAFTLEERQVLGIHGLQPARFKTQEEQLELCKISINRYQEDLNKYLYLIDLQDRNEKLFFRLLSENVEQMMPIVYTPTVGLACQKFGLIYRRPRGLFITINDRGHVYEVLRNWPEPDVRAIVVTDGERILGLGDLGACGMGIPVGKLALYTALAGIQPHQCLPIQIDVGTNNQDLIEDPLYIGLRQKRIVGEEYDSFIDEFMQAVVKRYGQNTLIQFEDFGNHNAFRFLDKYRNHYCTFNDDIQGTAAVAVAGLYASRRITNKKFTDNTFLFAGAGEAAIGIADLCVKAMQAEGITQEEARSKIWMVDIDGLLTKNRPKGKLEGHKKFYAKDHEPMEKLEEIVNHLKPSVLIGASAASGLFTPKILTAMASFNERPIVFALSNPTSKAECTAEQAFHNTDGRVIFASGSPFGTVHYDGKTFSPGQGNNAYIFPGVALGVNATMTHHIPDDFFLIAARELSDSVSEADLEKGSLYPPLSCIREVSMRIAMGITKFAYDKGLASTYPEPTDKRKWLENQLFNFNYESSMPVTWPWPKPPMVKTRELVPTKLFRDPK